MISDAQPCISPNVNIYYTLYPNHPTIMIILLIIALMWLYCCDLIY